MQIRFSTKTVVAALSATVAFGLTSCFSTVEKNEKSTVGAAVKVVNVDVNLPLTGELGGFGSSLRDSMSLAIEDINKSNSKPLKLNFDWQDNLGNPKNTVSVFQKQYLDPPDIYVSGFTPQTLAIKDQVAAKGTPHFVWIFSAFINQGSRNNLRTLVNYKIEPQLYFEYIKKRKPKRVAIVYVNVPYAVEQFNKIVTPRLPELGVKDVLTESYEIGTKDYKTIAAKVKQFKPDLIIVNGFSFTLTPLVRALRPLGLIANGNTIGTFDTIDLTETLGKDELEGIRMTAPVFITRPEKVADWNKKFQNKFGRAPKFPDAYAYDMVQVINDAGKRLTLPAKSEQWLEAIKATKLEGITGSISFDKDGDINTPIEIGKFQNGKIVPDESVGLGK
jgi:branched-chain amino acid transport system substrate-binding protein